MCPKQPKMYSTCSLFESRYCFNDSTGCAKTARRGQWEGRQRCRNVSRNPLSVSCITVHGRAQVIMYGSCRRSVAAGIMADCHGRMQRIRVRDRAEPALPDIDFFQSCSCQLSSIRLGVTRCDRETCEMHVLIIGGDLQQGTRLAAWAADCVVAQSWLLQCITVLMMGRILVYFSGMGDSGARYHFVCLVPKRPSSDPSFRSPGPFFQSADREIVVASSFPPVLHR